MEKLPILSRKQDRRFFQKKALPVIYVQEDIQISFLEVKIE